MSSFPMTTTTVATTASFSHHQPEGNCGQPFSMARNHRTSDENWKSVQNAVVGLFQRKKLGTNQLCNLRKNMKHLNDSKIGSFMFDFYLKQVLTRGAVILREKVRALKGVDLLVSLAETWTYFYCEILPNLQAIFFPYKPKQVSIRHAVLLTFRDVVVLKVTIRDALEVVKPNEIPSGIKQMLLVLQSVHDTTPPNDQRLALEKLVAKVVIPYLGFMGLYLGMSDPYVPSKEPGLTKKRKDCRRLNRPTTLHNFKSHVTVEDMYRAAYSKDSKAGMN